MGRPISGRNGTKSARGPGDRDPLQICQTYLLLEQAKEDRDDVPDGAPDLPGQDKQDDYG